jgi:hypothetical protein
MPAITRREAMMQLTALQATAEGPLTAAIEKLRAEHPTVDPAIFDRLLVKAMAEVSDVTREQKQAIRNLPTVGGME